MYKNWLSQVFHILEGRHGVIEVNDYDKVDFRAIFNSGAINTEEAANIADVINDWSK